MEDELQRMWQNYCYSDINMFNNFILRRASVIGDLKWTLIVLKHEKFNPHPAELRTALAEAKFNNFQDIVNAISNYSHPYYGNTWNDGGELLHPLTDFHLKKYITKPNSPF